MTAGRTQELGIRAALGASRGDLVRLVVAGGSVPVLVGIALGPWLRGRSYAIYRVDALCHQPLDATSLVTVAVLLLAVALAACLAPAWRAARAHPMSALKQE